jgi:HEPN domain-containing protein
MENDYKMWLDRAKSSLAISKNKSDKDIFFEDLCFQAQQSVEEAIKGAFNFLQCRTRKNSQFGFTDKRIVKIFYCA